MTFPRNMSRIKLALVLIQDTNTMVPFPRIIVTNLNFKFSLEKCFLGVQLPGHQVHQVVIAKGQGDIGFTQNNNQIRIRQIERQIYRQIDRKIDRQTERETDRQIVAESQGDVSFSQKLERGLDRQTDRQKDGHKD